MSGAAAFHAGHGTIGAVATADVANIEPRAEIAPLRVECILLLPITAEQALSSTPQMSRSCSSMVFPNDPVPR